jgi:RNA polymerase sigma-70 factor (ECF subfamily)
MPEAGTHKTNIGWRAGRVRESDEARIETLITQIASAELAEKKDALGELYSLTSSAVYGYALSITRDGNIAQDIAQDVFLRVYKAAGQYHTQGKPMAWILTITRNLSLMTQRGRERNASSLSLDAAGWTSGEGAGEGGGQASVAEREGAYENSHDEAVLDSLTLKAVLSGLGDDERQIVILHAVCGMKHREIAQLMELALSTVLSKYNRSLAKLRKHLGGRQR